MVLFLHLFHSGMAVRALRTAWSWILVARCHTVLLIVGIIFHCHLFLKEFFTVSGNAACHRVVMSYVKEYNSARRKILSSQPELWSTCRYRYGNKSLRVSHLVLCNESFAEASGADSNANIVGFKAAAATSKTIKPIANWNTLSLPNFLQVALYPSTHPHSNNRPKCVSRCVQIENIYQNWLMWPFFSAAADEWWYWNFDLEVLHWSGKAGGPAILVSMDVVGWEQPKLMYII